MGAGRSKAALDRSAELRLTRERWSRSPEHAKSPVAGSGGDVRLLRQQPMAFDDGCRDVGELGVGPARMVAHHLEGLGAVDRVTLHQDALGSLDDRSAAERALEVVVLG